MKKKTLISLSALLLAVICLFSGVKLAGSEVNVERCGSALLFLPDAPDQKAVPAVELLRDGSGELLRCCETAVELARRGYGVLVAPLGGAREGWDTLCADRRINPRALAAGCFSGGKSALCALWESTAGEECIPRALLFLSTAVPVEEQGLGNVLCLCPGEEADEGSIDGYFGELSARRTMVLPGSEHERLREGLPCVIDWVGSTLGHPRDGVYGDDELLYPRSELWLSAGAALTGAAVILLLLPRRKKDGAAES